MNTFVTSDLHFGHRSIINFCPRTRGHYRDVDRMNEEMIYAWNDSVHPEDTVYILGDVSFLNATKTVNILRRLNGTLRLISGNHDEKLLKNQEFRDCFAEITPYKEIDHNGIKVVMFHFPIKEWNKCHRGSVHFHGHLHGNPSGLEKYRVLDVGYDSTGLVVIPLEHAIKRVINNQILSHGNGE